MSDVARVPAVFGVMLSLISALLVVGPIASFVVGFGWSETPREAP